MDTRGTSEADRGRISDLDLDDSERRVPRNGTKGPALQRPRLADVVRPGHAPGLQPSSGRRIWMATTMTSQATGTAAKNPRAALQPVRRRTVPEPVGWGTTSQVTMVPMLSTIRL